MSDPLARLRVRLTAWYVGVFAAILLLFGGALLLAVAHQMSSGLDRSLVRATREIARAVRIRERERRQSRGAVVDALEELRIPDRALYVFDARGVPVHPTAAPAWIRDAARGALARGEVWRRWETGGDRTWRLYARRVSGESGLYAAVAVADAVEIEQQYPALIAAFALAALGSLVLVAAGGTALARKSTQPVERTLEQMRRFVADAAHELRTPAAVLRGRAEVALQRPRTPEEYAEVLNGIRREAERLGGILDNLLLLASVDAGGFSARQQRVYLDDVLLDAASAARVLGAAKGVRVDVGSFEEAPTLGDPELIRQLFVIVLDNAVKFTPPGGRVEVAVSATAGECRVGVSDTGPGIPAAALPHIWERFWRGDPARSRLGGAGLGLPIARSIAEAHGATIRIRSRPGEGTKVLLAFPRADESSLKGR